MKMNPIIKIISEKKLVGKSLKMSLANNKTHELWKSFMCQRHSIKNVVNSDLYSVQLYNDFAEFTPNTVFTKYAMIEVSEFEEIPHGMETRIIKSGLYAVFTYIGKPENFSEAFQFIFNNWLPNSEYELDQREHFELLGEKYNPTSNDSEEQIWIPIKVEI